MTARVVQRFKQVCPDVLLMLLWLGHFGPSRAKLETDDRCRQDEVRLLERRDQTFALAQDGAILPLVEHVGLDC